MKQTEYIQTAYEVEKIFKFNKNILVIEKQIGCLQTISHNKISKTQYFEGTQIKDIAIVDKDKMIIVYGGGVVLVDKELKIIEKFYRG